jgi:hypothetical protein
LKTPEGRGKSLSCEMACSKKAKIFHLEKILKMEKKLQAKKLVKKQWIHDP